jgi:hypothetical protein
LKLGNAYCALSDARAVSEDESLLLEHRNKARYRMALAYYTMDRFQTPKIVDDGVSSKFFPTEINELRKKLKARMKERTHGEYDWFALEKTILSEGGRNVRRR